MATGKHHLQIITTFTLQLTKTEALFTHCNQSAISFVHCNCKCIYKLKVMQVIQDAHNFFSKVHINFTSESIINREAILKQYVIVLSNLILLNVMAFPDQALSSFHCLSKGQNQTIVQQTVCFVSSVV